MPPDPPVVFVVDDDASVRQSLELLIESAGWATEGFGSAQDFLARPRASGPCCLLLDVCLPDLSGLDLQALVADRTEMPVIFITGHVDVPMVVRAMQAGAVEFLTKPVATDALLSAIGGAIDRSRSELGRAVRLGELQASYASLTRREQEVMVLVASGRLNKQVGYQLGISEITVKAHRGRMMRKLHAGSLCELVRIADSLFRAAR